MKVEYLGHSAFLLEGEGGKALIDPYLKDNPLASASGEDLDPDLILVTHAHHDHLGDAIGISRRTGAHILTTPEIAAYCQEEGAEVIAAHMGGAVDRFFCSVKVFPAWHSSSIGGRMLGVPCSFVVIMDGRTVYHAGDTALFSDMSLIGEEFDLDLALLPIGGLYTMGADDAIRALRFLGAGAVIPMHYDTFEAIRADSREFCSRVETEGRRCHPLPPGGSVEL